MNFPDPENAAKAQPFESWATIQSPTENTIILRFVMSNEFFDLTAAIQMTIHHHLKDSRYYNPVQNSEEAKRKYIPCLLARWFRQITRSHDPGNFLPVKKDFWISEHSGDDAE